MHGGKSLKAAHSFLKENKILNCPGRSERQYLDKAENRLWTSITRYTLEMQQRKSRSEFTSFKRETFT